MENENFTINTAVAGEVHVFIEGIGDYNIGLPMFAPLCFYAGLALAIITGKTILTSNERDLFELVSFEPQKNKATFRLKR